MKVRTHGIVGTLIIWLSVAATPLVAQAPDPNSMVAPTAVALRWTALGPRASSMRAAVAQRPWRRHRIFVVAIKQAEFEGLRVLSNVRSTLEELACIGDAVERVIERDPPAV